jgi:hypothetical protein
MLRHQLAAQVHLWYIVVAIIFVLSITFTQPLMAQPMHHPGGPGNIGTASQNAVGVGINTNNAGASLQIENRPGPDAGVGLLLLRPIQYEDFYGNPVIPAYTLRSQTNVGQLSFEISSGGLTRVGNFSSFSPQPTTNLSVRTDMGVYHSSHLRYLRFRVAGASPQPTVEWRTDNNTNLVFQCMDNNNTTPVLHLSPQGKVGVGTNYMPGTHTLYVSGSMIMEEAFVKIQANWPDYVFGHDYALMPLKDLGTYIAEQGRLPGMPGAAQVAEDGVALGETQRLLTEKVEELTLYLLQMHQEMNALRQEISTLKHSNNQ